MYTVILQVQPAIAYSCAKQSIFNSHVPRESRSNMECFFQSKLVFRILPILSKFGAVVRQPSGLSINYDKSRGRIDGVIAGNDEEVCGVGPIYNYYNAYTWKLREM